MHEAYDAVTVITNQQQQCAIECMTAYADKLLIGTKNGMILIYSIKNQGGSTYHTNLDRTIKHISRKPVVQLEAIPELDILISLSDNTLSVYELSSMVYMKEASDSLEATKGAAVFSVDVQAMTTLDGQTQYNLRLVVAVRRKVQLYYWKAGIFYDFYSKKRVGGLEGSMEREKELVVPDTPKTLCLCKDSICIGFKREYYLINIVDAGLKELFSTGKHLDPSIAKLSIDELALTKDNMSVFINDQGNPSHKYGLVWSENPLGVVFRKPYLIGLLPKMVEVRTIEPKSVIQNIELDKPRYICHSRDGVMYVGSPSHVWRLVFVSVSKQIRQLMDKKEFELALKLGESEGADALMLQKIKNMHAFELFCQKRFEESLKIFASLDTDPSNVIGLYPNLLPKEFTDKLKFPTRIPDLRGSDLEKAIHALIEYLTQKRAELQKYMVPVDNPPKFTQVQPLVEGGETTATTKQLSQIIDTTLLKCYLEINDALVAHLLRLKDNNCHIKETEDALIAKDKLDELIILYETKGLHEKALTMLRTQAQNPKALESLQGLDRIVDYLQRLGKDKMDIILKYSQWVLDMDLDKGLSIFIADVSEVEHLPRNQVLSFLQTRRNNKKLVIPYLKYIIEEWHEANPDFHDQLVNAYREELQPLVIEYQHSLPDDHVPVPAGQEGGELGELREQLLRFLRKSRLYRAAKLIKFFPYEYLHDERVILLGRSGQHKQALFICINMLGDYSMAEEYCREYYDPKIPEAADVYVYLLGYYMKPVDATDSKRPNSSKSEHDDKAIQMSIQRVLKQHSNKLDVSKVLTLLPDDFALSDLLPFLEDTIKKREMRRRQATVIRNLLQSEKLVTESLRIQWQRTKFIVSTTSSCKVCHNKISTSSFARYPDGSLAHFSCSEEIKDSAEIRSIASV